MNETTPFKILSIDGGGIKGLFSAEILRNFEEHYSTSISNHFDLICGTSTGGLIALALSLKIPASRIVDFYKNDGKIIFPHTNYLSRSMAFGRQILFSSKYSQKRLAGALRQILEERKMRDANNLLCIPSYNLTQGRPKVFKSPFFQNGKNLWYEDENKMMVDVALATSAAPTYFPIHEIDNDYYADGGVWANNPTLCGIAEAIKYFIGKQFTIDDREINYSSIQLLSISSVNQPSGWSTKRIKNRSALMWLKGNKLLQPFMEGQSYYADYFVDCLTTSLQIPIEYKRINHNHLSIEKSKNIDLDKASRKSLQDLSALGNDTAKFYRSSREKEVEAFFKTNKSFKTTQNG